MRSCLSVCLSVCLTNGIVAWRYSAAGLVHELGASGATSWLREPLPTTATTSSSFEEPSSSRPSSSSSSGGGGGGEAAQGQHLSTSRYGVDLGGLREKLEALAAEVGRIEEERAAAGRRQRNESGEEGEEGEGGRTLHSVGLACGARVELVVGRSEAS
jgi:hypothetical protein